MSDVPAPLTPPGCNLQDFPFMPLDIARLRRSKAWLKAKRNPALAFYLINLWTASWHDVPAASLEDDDDVLSDLAMCDPAKWAKVREEALRGWVKCSDGRLYHATVAEKALEAWKAKLAQRARTEAARLAKELKRQQALSQTAQAITAAASVTGSVTEAVTESKGEGQGQGEREGQGQGQLENPSGSTPAKPARRQPRGAKFAPEDFEVTPEMQAWAEQNAPNVDWRCETEKFRDWEFKHPRTDWSKVWRTWMRKANDEPGAGRARRSPPTSTPAESFAERDRRAAMERWEQMTGQVHPEREQRAPLAHVIDEPIPALGAPA